jgi:hypothetical protein
VESPDVGVDRDYEVRLNLRGEYDATGPGPPAPAIICDDQHGAYYAELLYEAVGAQVSMTTL